MFHVYRVRPNPSGVAGRFGITVAVNVPAPALLFWIAECERRFGDRCDAVYVE